jgi:septal ring factor EnvC (AmiA/AmiB activator)
MFRAMLVKTKERAARIALVLHWLEAACSKVPPSEVIPANTLDKGIELALWLQEQAKANLQAIDDYSRRLRQLVSQGAKRRNCQ